MALALLTVLGLGVASQTALAAEDGTYGPTTRDDTLWSVANAVRPSGATMADTIEALQRMNPCAFVNGDPDRLVRGVILKIPTTAAMVASSIADSSVPESAEDVPAETIDDGREALMRRNAELEERLQAVDGELADAAATNAALTEEVETLRARLDETHARAVAARSVAEERADNALWIAVAGIVLVFVLLLRDRVFARSGRRRTAYADIGRHHEGGVGPIRPWCQAQSRARLHGYGAEPTRAREVLEEVLAEGSEEERSEAEELLGRLE